jgi:hypothetical protein
MGPKRFGLFVSIGSLGIAILDKGEQCERFCYHPDFAIARCITRMAVQCELAKRRTGSCVADRIDLGCDGTFLGERKSFIPFFDCPEND